MKQKIMILGVLMGLLAGSTVFAETDAVESATKWLGVVDSGDYVQAYNKSTAFVKSSNTDVAWVGKLNAVRQPLGRTTSRVSRGATSVNAAEGAPEGEYMTVTFDTTFEGDSHATETVTLKLADDGQWEQSNYTAVSV